MDRRFFLRSSGISLASFGMMAFAPSVLSQFANASSGALSKGKRKTVVVIFQRGAVDGLNMVIPYGESEYYDLRRNISIPGPQKANGALDLDGFFGLHPSLKPLHKFWDSKQLAVIQSAGSPNNTRSHFDAQDYMESATPGVKGTRDGFLNRVLESSRTGADSPFRGVSMTQRSPRSIAGKYPFVSMTNISDFTIKAGDATSSVRGGFEGIYAEAAKDTVRRSGKETFEAVEYLKKASPQSLRPENGAVYPGTPFGRSLMQIGQLIKSSVGLEIAFAEMGGWDTHVNEVNPNDRSQGQLANLFRDFGGSIAALATDLGKRMDDVVIVTMSEFGRTVRENGSRGTDHGHGNAMMVLGGGVKGGKVYGDWRGLKSSALYEGRDLAVTTDFRDVLAEITDVHLGNRNFDKLFPGYDVKAADRRRLLG